MSERRDVPDTPVIWRGSVSDLVTDLRALLSLDQVEELSVSLVYRATGERLEGERAEKPARDPITREQRRVLTEMERAEIVPGCHRGIHCCPKFEDRVREHYVCKAELARREAEKPRSEEAEKPRSEEVEKHGSSGSGSELPGFRASELPVPPLPVPMLLWCPECNERHVDVGDFATKPHLGGARRRRGRHEGHARLLAQLERCGALLARLEGRAVKDLVASARVTLVLVFEDLGTWNASTPAEEIFRKAASTALDHVRDLVDSGACQVVGEPVVECVIGRSST